MSTATRQQSAREQVLRDYSHNSSGIITQPGKFESEPIFAPYFWNLALEGFADEDTNDGFAWRLDASDFALWPELRTQGFSVGDELHLRESEQGFVYCN